MRNTENIKARLMVATMKRYDALKAVKGSNGDAERNSAARAKLRDAERVLAQACETFEKSGCQP